MLTAGILGISVRAGGGGAWARAAGVLDRSGRNRRGGADQAPEGDLRQHVWSLWRDHLHGGPGRLLGSAAPGRNRIDVPRDHLPALDDVFLLHQGAFGEARKGKRGDVDLRGAIEQQLT